MVISSDYGGDFSASGISGAGTPGANSGTMGNQATSAMAIGTGASGTGDYASNYKTPNFTQYTQQDFKGSFFVIRIPPCWNTLHSSASRVTEFMPNYQEMMNTTMMGGGSRGAGSGFANFTSVNVMLKGFMELQKQQMEVEKAKADSRRSRAKPALNLALHEDADVEAETRQKRSIAVNSARRGGSGHDGTSTPVLFCSGLLDD